MHLAVSFEPLKMVYSALKMAAIPKQTLQSFAKPPWIKAEVYTLIRVIGT